MVLAILAETSQTGLFALAGVIITAIVAPTWLSWWNTKQTKKEFKPNGGSSIRDSLNRLETSVASSRQTSLTLASALGVAYFQTDAEGKYKYVSREWQRMAGMFAEDAMGNGWINGIARDDRMRVASEWRESVSHHRAFRVTCHMNSGARVNVTANPIKSPTGALDGYVGFCERDDHHEVDTGSIRFP